MLFLKWEFECKQAMHVDMALLYALVMAHSREMGCKEKIHGREFLCINRPQSYSYCIIINSVLLNFLPHLFIPEARVFLHSGMYSFIHIVLFHVDAESNFICCGGTLEP